MADLSTPSNQSGIMTWVSSIRTTMANDPGRQMLEDQIRTDGFSFLEDYLESILAKPRHDPIIELVKTPARRRNAPKKFKSATTAVVKGKPIVTTDLEEVDSDKENEAPFDARTPDNELHEAHSQSKAKDANPSRLRELAGTHTRSALGPAVTCESSTPKKPFSRSNAATVTDVASENAPLAEEEDGDEKPVETLITPPRSKASSPHGQEVCPPKPFTSADWVEPRLNPSRPERLAELSVIEEGEEPAERSSHSIVKQSCEDLVQASDKSTTKNAGSPKPYPKKALPSIDMATVMDIDDVTQTMNFGNAPGSGQSSKAGPLDDASTSTASNSSVRMSQAQSSKSRPSTPQGPDYSTAPLPTSVPSAETGLEDQPAEASTTENPGVSAYPTIGPPSPLRKSIRVPRDPSLAAMHVPSAIKQTTSQSSWLVKAREAKAVEEGAKKVIPKSALAHYLGAGNKRKSGEMLATPPGSPEDQDQGRMQKLTKITEAPSLAILSKEHEKYTFGRLRDETVALADDSVDEGATTATGSNGMIDKLKKTVAGFSARAGRSMGKSLGGAAATALAEARAAAEAKVAEREGRAVPAPRAVAEANDPSHAVTTSVPAPLPQTQVTSEGRISGDKDRRLSVSDLLSTSDSKKGKGVERVFQPPPSDQSKMAMATVNNTNPAANTSTSTTPPNSPPKARPPIFTLPEKPKLLSAPTFFPPPLTQTFSQPESRPFGPPHVPQPLSVQPTLFSTQITYPDAIFDDEIPTWVPSTQDTDFSDHGPSQSTLLKGGNRVGTEPDTDMDVDESWHLDEKFGETWTPVVIGMKDDSMTWSSVPTRSTRSAGTGILDASVPPGQPTSASAQEPLDTKNAAFEAIPSDNPPCTTTDEIEEEDMDVELDEGVASIRLVTPAPQNKISRSSAQSSKHQFQEEMKESSNNVGGFFSSASKLVSSVLGGSKKGKEPVKSLQLAAVAAKKQQEEAEKKTNRLNQMEARRQQVLQKKAEDDKAREEKKAREETERWKREREKDDITEKKALKQPGKKLAHADDDIAKKHKAPEMEKKAEPKKPPSKDKKNAPATKIGKFAPTSSQSGVIASTLPSKAIKQGTATATATQNFNKATVQGDTKATIPAKIKEKAKEKDVASKQPSQPVHSQMQKRYQARLDDSRKGQVHPQPTSTESVELPDINSEYSDSSDENRPRTFDPPGWAQSPELREALQSQSTVNPDDIFGAIRPLKMEELFKNRTSRFRARTSSANWAGVDELTAHEEREYARRMGYKT